MAIREARLVCRTLASYSICPQWAFGKATNSPVREKLSSPRSRCSKYALKSVRCTLKPGRSSVLKKFGTTFFGRGMREVFIITKS